MNSNESQAGGRRASIFDGAVKLNRAGIHPTRCLKFGRPDGKRLCQRLLNCLALTVCQQLEHHGIELFDQLVKWLQRHTNFLRNNDRFGQPPCRCWWLSGSYLFEKPFSIGPGHTYNQLDGIVHLQWQTTQLSNCNLSSASWFNAPFTACGPPASNAS